MHTPSTPPITSKILQLILWLLVSCVSLSLDSKQPGLAVSIGFVAVSPGPDIVPGKMVGREAARDLE